MPQSPSPNTSPSPKSSVPNLKDVPISSQTLPEDTEAKDTGFRPKLAFVGIGDAGASKDGRRPSIQFAPSVETPVREVRQRAPSMKLQRRLSSPPPPSTYQPRVGFDTSENKNVTDFSFTMSSKHKNYKSTARSRTFLCGTDENDYSEFALEWLLEELVNEDDEIVCLRVVNPDTKTDVDASVLQETYKEEAKRLLDHFQKKNEDGIAISWVVELAVGKVEETIQAMIKIYSPASLIVGTKGKSLGGIQGLRKGSISKYCLQNSPVPVIVVRPKDKRMKKKARRSQNPKRQNYKSILEQSSATGIDAFAQAQQSDKSTGTETEANAVAKAIGLNDDETALGDRKDRPGSAEGGQSSRPPMTRTISSKSDTAYETESPSPTGPLLVVDDEGDEVPEMQLPGSLDEAAEGEGQVIATTKGKKNEEAQQFVAEASGKKVEQQKEDEVSHETEGQEKGKENQGK